ncbi:MAG: hypothetical protein GXP47_03880 [Acidobacteria bacterium]|nr:hypothetical protein [Acidobacteriota bacterium]
MDVRVSWPFLLPALLSASYRASRCFATLPLDRAVEQLADVRLLPPPLRDPVALRELVDRILPWLPPRCLRSCLKRSLLLMDLWSRCGLAPRFHLGLLAGKTREGHAWVTVEDAPALSTDPALFSDAQVAPTILWETAPAAE